MLQARGRRPSPPPAARAWPATAATGLRRDAAEPAYRCPAALLQGRRVACRTSLAAQVAVGDLHLDRVAGDVGAGNCVAGVQGLQSRGELFGHRDTAMLAARATDRQGQETLSFALIARDQN